MDDSKRKSQGSSKKLVIKKKRETIRERVDKSANPGKAPRIRKLASASVRPAGKVTTVLKKEYHPLRTGNSKAGRVLSRRGRLFPRYFADSFAELRQVSWPSRKTAFRLMFAVFFFSVVLATLVRALDYGFDKLFQEVILK